MATVGTAKSVLVDKINSLTSSATPKDTIFLAKALGEATSLTNFVWKGAWTTGTEYAIDDVVRNGNDSYVCVTAHTAGATFSGDSAKWELMMQGSDIPSQTGNSGKVLKTDGSTLSWGDGLPTGGTAGQYITTDGTTASWGDVSQKVLQTVTATASAVTSSSVAIGSYSGSSIPDVGAAHISVNITPVSSTSKLVIMANAPSGTGANGTGLCGVFVDNVCRGALATNGYSADASGATITCFAQNSSTSQRTVEFRAIGEWTGNVNTLGQIRNGHTTSFDGIYGSLIVMEVE